MEEKEIHDELSAIRGLMERSSKFISLSGLSGILAGIYALIGAGLAYKVLDSSPDYAFVKSVSKEILVDHNARSVWLHVGGNYTSLVLKLSTIALVVLIASIATALVLSIRQAKRKGQPMWGKVSRSLLFHTSVPLAAGGTLIIVLLCRYHYSIIAPCSLIFYGLALVSASNFTFTDVKYLGLLEIALGLIAACLPGYGLLFWAIGFGVLHIIYGSMMYLKYDR